MRDIAGVFGSSHTSEGTPLQSEKLLMLAVLEHAVDDLRTYAMVPTGRGSRIYLDVQAWFASSAAGPFDFEGICEAVGLDPAFVRKGLRRWYGTRQPRPVGSSCMASRADTVAMLPTYPRKAHVRMPLPARHVGAPRARPAA